MGGPGAGDPPSRESAGRMPTGRVPKVGRGPGQARSPRAGPGIRWPGIRRARGWQALEQPPRCRWAPPPGARVLGSPERRVEDQGAVDRMPVGRKTARQGLGPVETLPALMSPAPQRAASGDGPSTGTSEDGEAGGTRADGCPTRNPPHRPPERPAATDRVRGRAEAATVEGSAARVRAGERSARRPRHHHRLPRGTCDGPSVGTSEGGKVGRGPTGAPPETHLTGSQSSMLRGAGCRHGGRQRGEIEDR